MIAFWRSCVLNPTRINLTIRRCQRGTQIEGQTPAIEVRLTPTGFQSQCIRKIYGSAGASPSQTAPITA